MNSHIGVAVLVLGSALLATPARAQTFQVDAERNGATIIRRPCDGGPCCNTCHVGQLAPDKKPPKHDRELYAKYLVQLAEGKRMRVSRDSYVTREKGELVLYEGKIVEHGRHDELLERRGMYFELVQKQLSAA